MKAIITTTNLRDGMLWHQEELTSETVDCVHQVTVYPYARYQTFAGFGGAFTEASAYAWQQLPPERRQAFLDLYFGSSPQQRSYSALAIRKRKPRPKCLL